MAVELGEIKKRFKPALENAIAGIIIGLLLLGGGFGSCYAAIKDVIENKGPLPFWAEQGDSWGSVALFGAFGIGFGACGLCLIWYARSMFSYRVCVCQNGLCVSEGRKTRFVHWDDIEGVRETHIYERPPILNEPAQYLLPKFKSKSYAVYLDGGEPIEFSGNDLKGHVKLAKMVKEETDKRNVPWEILEEQG